MGVGTLLFNILSLSGSSAFCDGLREQSHELANAVARVRMQPTSGTGTIGTDLPRVKRENALSSVSAQIS